MHWGKPDIQISNNKKINPTCSHCGRLVMVLQRHLCPIPELVNMLNYVAEEIWLQMKLRLLIADIEMGGYPGLY